MKLQKKYAKLKLFILSLVFFTGCLTGCSRMPTTNFQQIDLSKFPNYFLLCPKNYCNVTSVESPVFPVPADDLFNMFNEIIASENNANFVYSIPEQGQFGLTVYSSFLHFPEDVDVQFIALSDNTSTLAIYSKSRYLPYDFALNRLRIEAWVNNLAMRAKIEATKAPATQQVS